MIGEVSKPKLTDEEFEELTAFITRSGRVSKPVTYLHPEGKRKEEMIEEDCETTTQKKAKAEEEKRKYEILEAAIRKSHLFLIEQLSKTLA